MLARGAAIPIEQHPVLVKGLFGAEKKLRGSAHDKAGSGGAQCQFFRAAFPALGLAVECRPCRAVVHVRELPGVHHTTLEGADAVAPLSSEYSLTETSRAVERADGVVACRRRNVCHRGTGAPSVHSKHTLA